MVVCDREEQDFFTNKLNSRILNYDMDKNIRLKNFYLRYNHKTNYGDLRELFVKDRFKVVVIKYNRIYNVILGKCDCEHAIL